MRTLLLLLALACRGRHEAPATGAPSSLAELQGLPELAAGSRLMAGPEGQLLRLDAPPLPRDRAVIAVHGYKSKGAEWVEPLKTMAGWETQLYYYHWNWNQCPSKAAAELDRALDNLVAAQPSLQSLLVIGHSYGGLMSAVMGQTQNTGKPTQLHLIAAPLAGIDMLDRLCAGDVLRAAPPTEGVRWRQWRTVHEADGAFREMETDPQILEVPELTVTQLPAEWEGGRLGHNRAIQYVLAELNPTRGQ